MVTSELAVFMTQFEAKYFTVLSDALALLHVHLDQAACFVVWSPSAKCRNRLMHALCGNGSEKAETPQELKNWFVAFLPEISGSMLYDTLKHECGLVMTRKLRESLQQRMKKQVTDEKGNVQSSSSSSSKSQAKTTAKTGNAVVDDWYLVSRKKLQKDLSDLQLRSHEWNVPILSATQVFSNSEGVALSDQYDAERKVDMVTSNSALAFVVANKLNNDKECKKVTFSCQDGDKVVSRTGFLYQLGSGNVSRVVDQKCPVLSATCSTAEVVFEIEQAEAPGIWKKLRPLLGKVEGDEKANKPAIKDMLRGLLRDLGLTPVDVWIRQAFVHDSEHGKMVQVMLRVESKFLVKFLQMSGQNGIYFQEARSRMSTTDHKVIWLEKDAGFKQALQKASALSAHMAVFGLARTARSRGVRVLKTDEGAARRHLRPDLEDDGIEVAGNWEVKGWPVGTVNKPDVKSALAPCWQVRPLGSKVQNGVRAWTVAAGGAPPSSVLEIMVDANGNTCMLEIHESKGRKQNAVQRDNKQQSVLRSSVVVPRTTVADAGLGAVSKLDSNDVLKKMKEMMVQMNANMECMGNMVASVKQQMQVVRAASPRGEAATVDASMEQLEPQNLDAQLKDAEKENDGEQPKESVRRATSRTPRRAWQGSPKGAGKPQQ